MPIIPEEKAAPPILPGGERKIEDRSEGGYLSSPEKKAPPILPEGERCLEDLREDGRYRTLNIQTLNIEP
jgi:hypothetical protein